MNAIRRAWLRVVNLMRGDRADRAFARELSAHLELLEDEFRRQGFTDDEARRKAHLAIGGIENAKEMHRDARSYRWIDNARRDIRYGLRMISRSPVATTAAVLSLALGVGLNAAVFAVVDWVVVRPLPYPQSQQLVRVRTTSTGAQPVGPTTGLVTSGEFARLSAVSSFRSSAAFTNALRILGGAGVDAVHAGVARVEGDLFGTLGLEPRAGRWFTASEREGAAVVVLGYGFWLRQYHGDEAIAGRPITVDGKQYTVVGVMPARGQYPADADVWRPMTADERADGDRDLMMIARLADGVSTGVAGAELTALSASIEDLQRSETADVRAALGAISASAVLILLIVCANVATLLGARSSDRVSELAVRRALGATRVRLVSQIVTESMTIVMIGAVAGLVLGKWALNFLLHLAPAGVPHVAEVALDWRIIGPGLALAPILGILVGLPPAFRLSRAEVATGTPSRRATTRSRSRRILVFAQVAMAVMLATGASLLGRSLANLVAIDNGFTVDRLAAIDLTMRGGGDLRPLFHDLTEAVESIPGVRGAAFAMQLPTQTAGLRTQIQLTGQLPSPVTATLRPVGARYFDVLNVPLISGRSFDKGDSQTGPKVGVVNTRFVRDILGGVNAVGAKLAASLLKEPLSIVGVVGDLTPAGAADRPALYVPVDQVSVGGRMFLIVNSAVETTTITPALSARVRSIAPALASDRVVRVANALEDSRSATRFSTQLVSAFAGLALLLAAVGLYGLAAGEVTARWRELAVRLALGASQGRALWTVVRPAAVIIGGGAIAGVVIAALVAPTFASLLRGIRVGDVTILLVAPTLLIVVGMAATLIACARVFHVDPAETLRAE